MEEIKSVIKIPTLVFSLFLLWISYFIKGSPFELIYFVQTKVLKRACTAEAIGIDAPLIVAVFYAIITFLAIVLLFAAVFGIVYEKPLIESARKQLNRNAAFFGLLSNVVVSLAWEIIWCYLPAKPADYTAPITISGNLLDFASSFDDGLLSMSVIVVFAFFVAFVFGICVNSNVWLNVICGALWFVYSYQTLYVTTIYIEYGKWFLAFVLLCYLAITVSVLVSKVKKEEPLESKYKVLILSLDDEEDEEEFRLRGFKG